MNKRKFSDNMRLSDGAKKIIFPSIKCDECKRQLEKSEFIAIIGNTPSTGLSMPMGRADAIFKKLGKYIVSNVSRKDMKVQYIRFLLTGENNG
jgi:hypothetical protein